MPFSEFSLPEGDDETVEICVSDDRVAVPVEPVSDDPGVVACVPFPGFSLLPEEGVVVI